MEVLMTTEKKGRGRPKGTGINDMPVLRAMAERIVAQPALKPTAAFKSVNGDWLDKDIRRIQIKWRASGERLLAEARARRSRPVSYGGRSATQLMDELVIQAAMARQTMEQFDSMTMWGIREAHKNAVVQAAVDAYSNSAGKLARDMALYNSATAQFARGLYDTPTTRLAREIEKIQDAMRWLR